jgi:hypothetical protein
MQHMGNLAVDGHGDCPCNTWATYSWRSLSMVVTSICEYFYWGLSLVWVMVWVPSWACPCVAQAASTTCLPFWSCMCVAWATQISTATCPTVISTKLSDYKTSPTSIAHFHCNSIAHSHHPLPSPTAIAIPSPTPITHFHHPLPCTSMYICTTSRYFCTIIFSHMEHIVGYL